MKGFIIKTTGSLFTVCLISTQALTAADVTGARLNIGSSHSLSAADGSIAGGAANTITAGGGGAFIGGGVGHTIAAETAFIGGGLDNIIGVSAGSSAFIGGGNGNSISSFDCAIVGGNQNLISTNSDSSFIGGGANNSIIDNDKSIIVGGSVNSILTDAQYAMIGGGVNNMIMEDGEFSFIGNGVSNAITDHAEYSFVGNGIQNTNQSSFSFIGGGIWNLIQANGTYASIGGGLQNTATGTNSTIPGGAQAKASHYGQLAYASGAFAAVGDAQGSQFILRQTTPNSTPKELFLDGVGQRMSIASGSSWSFEILVIGRSTSNSGGYRVQGVIENNGGTTSFIGAPVVTTMGEDVAGWDVSVTADNTNDALVINVTGDSGSVRWVANVRTAEVSL